MIQALNKEFFQKREMLAQRMQERLNVLARQDPVYQYLQGQLDAILIVEQELGNDQDVSSSTTQQDSTTIESQSD